MRVAIRQLLIDGVPEVEGRVFYEGGALPAQVRPFIVITRGVENPDMPYAHNSTIVEVWPYAKDKSFREVDRLSEAIIAALDKKRFSDTITGTSISRKYVSFYDGDAAADYMDPDFGGAYTRGLRFRVFSLAWETSLTYDPDPVAALRAWTEEVWPESVQDPNTWNPQDATPGIYWRIDRILQTEPVQWGSWVNAAAFAHIVAPERVTQEIWTRRVAQEVGIHKQIEMPDDSILYMLNVVTNHNADPFTEGQVMVIVRWSILDERPDQTGTGELLNQPISRLIILPS